MGTDEIKTFIRHKKQIYKDRRTMHTRDGKANVPLEVITYISMTDTSQTIGKNKTTKIRTRKITKLQNTIANQLSSYKLTSKDIIDTHQKSKSPNSKKASLPHVFEFSSINDINS